MNKLIPSVTIDFVPGDMWVGVYATSNEYYTDAYVCLVPCLPIHFTWKR